MPHIRTTTSLPMTDSARDRLAHEYGSAMTIIGKSEAWLMLSFEPETPMYFRGESEPCAFLEVSLLGKASPQAYDKLTAVLTQTVTETLGVAADHVYVKYSETPYWGWNGGNF